ncbi:MAG: PAS domain S-box protein [Proteobacteria bacterium]|nr:PAS domain S-box protein [Pseudomonadota bacterium]
MSERVDVPGGGDEISYRALVDAVTDYAIFRLDPQGNVVSWNPGAERIKGYRASEVIGTHFSRFHTDEDRAAGLPARVLAAAAAEGRFEGEGWRIRRDGTRFWAHVVVDPVRDEHGTLVGFAKITRDMTERRAAQDALDHARLELLQAQKMDAIGKLTGGVAHDFNNLLMAILSSLELYGRHAADGDLRPALLENAARAAERGVALTQRMLAFARKQELALQPVDVASLVATMTDLLLRTLGPAIEIRATLEPGLPAVNADPNQLELVLLNLATNARDAMPEGGVLSISAARGTAGDGNLAQHVSLRVRDDGAGMDHDTLARAVEPFFTTKGIGRGTGLGLSMVHGIVEQLGGQLVITSTPGTGTEVEVKLPLATGAPISAPVGAAPQAAAAAVPRSLNVLAVDDDALVLTNLVAMLEDLGHRVTAAGSCAEAQAAWEASPHFDLLITDYAMPRATGLQLTHALRAARADLPVILATGYAELPEGSGGTLERLTKPFAFADLEAAIERAVPPANA